MFGERGYLAFPRRVMARKPPQGFIAWCCSCCCSKASKEETDGVEDIHVCPRAEENFDEAGGNRLAVPKTGYDLSKEKRCSDEGRMEMRVMKGSSASAGEKWRLDKDNVAGWEAGIPMLRKYKPSDGDRYERGAGRGMQIQEIRVHHAQDDDEDDASISEDIPSVVLPVHSKSASPSPVVGAGSRKGPGSVSSGEWPPSPEEDIDRLVAIHQQRTSLSSLGPRSDSLASVYSGAGEGQYGTVAVKGEVEFGLEYNYKAGALEIHVKQCRDLAPVDAKRNRSDPYVKVYLLPDKSKSGKRKTKVKKHTLNPVFDETLKFQITLHGLETRTLWLTVWHSDMFGRNDFLGEVMMCMENKVFDDPSPHWYPLQERTEPFDDLLSYKGDLIIGLKFVPPDVTSVIQKKGKRSSRGSLNVLVKEAKNLTAVKANGTSDPFCKSYLLPDKGRSSKQKTPVLRRTCNPVWNYTFVYEDVSLQELSERSLELTVWDHDRLASNEFLGGLRFNLGTGKHYGKAVDWMDATGKEMTLWQHMLERPNFWVEGCLTLRPSLEHRNSS